MLLEPHTTNPATIQSPVHPNQYKPTTSRTSAMCFRAYCRDFQTKSACTPSSEIIFASAAAREQDCSVQHLLITRNSHPGANIGNYQNVG